MIQWILDILRGAVIGVSNIIPGVSGGTMAVSMGIYDRVIYAVNNLFKKFKKRRWHCSDSVDLYCHRTDYCWCCSWFNVGTAKKCSSEKYGF